MVRHCWFAIPIVILIALEVTPSHGGLIVHRSFGGATAGFHPNTNSAEPLTSVSASIDNTFDVGYFELDVEGMAGISQQSSDKSVSLVIANGYGSATMTRVTDPQGYAAADLTFGAGGQVFFEADNMDGAILRTSAFLSISGVVAPGDRLFYHFWGELYWFNGHVDFGFVEYLDAPGAFSRVLEFENPETVQVGVFPYFERDFRARVEASVIITKGQDSIPGAKTWFRLDPGIGIADASSSELFPWESPSAVPEPASLTLVGLGAVGMALGAYRRRQQRGSIRRSEI